MLRRIAPGRKRVPLSKRLKTHTTALSLFLQSAGSLALGLIMLLNDSFFIARVIQLIFLYFAFVLLINFIKIIESVGKGIGKLIQNISIFLACCVVSNFMWQNINHMFHIIPIALFLWLTILSLSSFISFFQYYKEKNVNAFRYIIEGIGNISFAILFVAQADNAVSASIHILGVYSMIFGGSVFLDFLAEVLPPSYIAHMKQHVHIAPPLVFTLLLPQNLRKSISNYSKENEEVLPVFKVEKNITEQEEAKINVEVFIHVSKTLAGTAGHVDLAIEDTVYCYGAYDKQQSKKYGGVVGEGVMYEVHNKADYLKFCKAFNNETLFGFGLIIEEKELNQMKEKIEEMKARSYPWMCPSQRARAKGEQTDVFKDFPSRLANEIHVSFCKFKNGAYKHYWMLGTNCVTFVDELLRIGGMKTVITAIRTPGSYYDFLNTVFLKGSTIVVKREVYTTAIEMANITG